MKALLLGWKLAKVFVRSYLLFMLPQVGHWAPLESIGSEENFHYLGPYGTVKKPATASRKSLGVCWGIGIHTIHILVRGRRGNWRKPLDWRRHRFLIGLKIGDKGIERQNIKTSKLEAWYLQSVHSKETIYYRFCVYPWLSTNAVSFLLHLLSRLSLCRSYQYKHQWTLLPFSFPHLLSPTVLSIPIVVFLLCNRRSRNELFTIHVVVCFAVMRPYTHIHKVESKSGAVCWRLHIAFSLVFWPWYRISGSVFHVGSDDSRLFLASPASRLPPSFVSYGEWAKKYCWILKDIIAKDKSKRCTRALHYSILGH